MKPKPVICRGCDFPRIANTIKKLSIRRPKGSTSGGAFRRIKQDYLLEREVICDQRRQFCRVRHFLTRRNCRKISVPQMRQNDGITVALHQQNIPGGDFCTLSGTSDSLVWLQQPTSGGRKTTNTLTIKDTGVAKRNQEQPIQSNTAFNRSQSIKMLFVMGRIGYTVF